MEVTRKVTVVPFTPELLPSVRAFSQAYWKRPTSAAYYEWRYLQPRAFSRMFVALRGDECVGSLFALRKRYRVGGQLVPCLEVFDWHTLPDLRREGVGIRLMRAMMKQGERIFAVGGTGDVHATLPLMGWQDVTTAKAYEMLLGPDSIAERLQRTRGVSRSLTRIVLAPVPRAVFRPRRVRGPAGGEVRVFDQPQDGVRALYEGATGFDPAQEPDSELLSWITRSQWSGAWRFVHFLVGGRLRGWAMTRVHFSGHGLQGTILDLFAPGADADLYRWMISETVASLLADRVQRIVTRASAPVLQQALAASGFRHAGIDAPVRTWPRLGPEPLPNPHFTYLHSDAPLLPYHTTEL